MRTPTIYESRNSFNEALDRNPSLVKTVEGWDNYPALTIFRNGSPVDGITYEVTAGEAVVVSTGVSYSPPNNLFTTEAFNFSPPRDTFTFQLAAPIRAFGITFSSTFAAHNGDFLATTDQGEIIPSFFDPIYPGSPIGQSIGFISERPFTSVTISSTANALYGMDDLILAIAPITGTNGKDYLRGTPFNDKIDGLNGKDTLIGLGRNDALDGGHGKDILIGVDPGNQVTEERIYTRSLQPGQWADGQIAGSDTGLLREEGTVLAPGTGEIDTLTGGTGGDTFVLGDSQNVYYNDRDASQPGLNDFAAIADFSCEDVIQLKGSRSDYQLEPYFAMGTSTGTGIFLKEASNELIGFVRGATDLNLNSNDFSFV